MDAYSPHSQFWTCNAIIYLDKKLSTFYSTVPIVPQDVIASLATFRTRTWSFRSKGFQGGNSAALLTGNQGCVNLLPVPCSLEAPQTVLQIGERNFLGARHIRQKLLQSLILKLTAGFMLFSFVLFSCILRTLLRCLDRWTTYANSFSTSARGQLSTGSGLSWAAFLVDENS